MNDNPNDFSKSSRGLSQGDPLSPLLLVIMFKQDVDESGVRGVVFFSINSSRVT